MDTKKMAHQMRLMHWAEVMRERSESGESIRSWCNKNGVNEKTYYYWQKRLRKVACEKLEELKASQQPDLMPKFTEVMLPEPSLHKMLPSEPNANQLIIDIGEMRITVNSSYPHEKLAELLRGVIKPC